MTVDEGALRALTQKGSSLLPIGIREVTGEFDTNAVVDIRAPDGQLVARGLAEYGSLDLQKIAGHRTGDLAALLGGEGPEEAVHRDKLVLLKS